MNRRRTLTFICVLSLSASAIAAAQKALKVDVDLVMFNVSVTDAENRPVKDLQPENFQIFEDKVEQKIQNYEKVMEMLENMAKTFHDIKMNAIRNMNG